MKRLLGLFLALVLLLTLLPSAVLAAPGNGESYLSVADQAYANLKKNYVDTANMRVRPVMWGYHNGETTNSGTCVPSFGDPGSLWESTVLLMAFDTYAQLPETSSERYNEVATIIANTVNYFISKQSRSELTGVPSSQNIAMDDAAWDMNGFILGYRYNTALSQSTQAAKCLDYAKTLFNNTYSTYYDSTDGLLWYNTDHESKASYAGAFLLAGWELYQITNEQSYLTKTQNVYNGMENGLKRSDGLYSVAKHTDGRIEGITDNNPYGIREGGSVTFLMGNTAMAVMHKRFGNDAKAKLTSEAIIRYMSYENGVLINDRDAWNNTFCFGPWVREVLNAGITDSSCFDGLFATADAITREASFDDGYYSAAWNGPREPSSDGYPSDFTGNRNGWGEQNGDAIQCGSTPRQIMTSATTANVLFAAAAATPSEDSSISFSGDGDWIYGSTTVDNTRDYEIDYDLTFPKITSAGNDVFADTGTLCIRNVDADDYINISLQSYRNGSGWYQVAASAQVWSGDWSARDFLWSDAAASPVTGVHMNIAYTASSGEYRWTVSNNANGAVLNTHAFPIERITEDLRSCGSCELKFQRNGSPYTIVPQNFTLTYAEDPELEKTPFSFTGSGEWQTAGIRPDNTRSYELGFDLYLPNVFAGGSNDSWPDEAIVNLRNESSDDYLWLRIKSYINGSGKYQIGTAGQTYADGWGTEDFQWCEKNYDAAVYSLHYTLTHDAETGSFTWKAVSNLDGSLLKEHTFAYDTPQSLADCSSCALMFRPGNGCAVHNAYIAYLPEQTDPEPTDSPDFSTDGVWQACGNETYKMSAEGAGWITFNAPLDATTGVEFSYEITAEEFRNNAIGSLLRIRCSENPNIYFFARLFLTGNAEHRIQGQLYNSSASPNWTDLMVQNSWVAGSVTDNTVRICVTLADGTLTVAFKNKAGQLLGTYSTAQLPAQFFTCETLQLMLGSEANNGKHRLSGFEGLPEIVDPDLRSAPFTKAVFAGDCVDDWTTELYSNVRSYQNSPLSTASCAADADAILAQNGNLIVIADGKSALSGGTSAADYAEDLAALVSDVKDGSAAGTVVVLCGLPYLTDNLLGSKSLETYAAYNAAIRSVAEENGALYADLYAAQCSTPWSVSADGSASGIGNSLIAGAILKELFRSCTCLSAYVTAPIVIAASAPAKKTDAALDAFISAADAAAVKAACEDAHLGLSLELYHGFSTAQQAAVIDAVLAEDRSGIDSYEAADALFGACCMAVSRAEAKDFTPKTFSTYVAVGDSISYGATAVNPATDAWVPHFAALIEAAQGSGLTLYNKAISGTRMCTVTDNGMFPPAKDTVDEYILPYAPDLLTIAYGINDFHAGTTLNEFITTYRGYLTEVAQGCPNAAVIVCGLCAKGDDADSASLRQWNAQIKALAEDFGYIYCETYYDMRGVEWLLTDRLHPTNAGYRVMANTLLRTLNAKVNLAGEPITPGFFGWYTDSNDFTGWSASDENSFGASYSGTANNHRIWKPVLTDQNNFTVSLDILPDANTSSAFLKLLGVTLELDSRGGNGSQSFVKLNGGHDWLSGSRIHVTVTREDGGELTYTISGADSSTPMILTAAAAQSNENIELGLYAGSAAFENICVVCGKQPLTEPKIRSAHLHINEDINVIFSVELPEDCINPYMVFTWHGNDIRTTSYTVDDDGKLLFELSKVVPQCMGDNISATLYAKKDGKTVSDTVEEYSVRTYCENQLAKTDDTKLITLLSDLLTYGAAAQTYTGYKTDALVTSGLDLTPSTFTAIEANRASFTGEKSAAADWYSATLGLANELSMRLTFSAASVDGLSVDVTVNGRTQTFTEFESVGDGRYAVMFRGIKATEFDDAVTASFKLGGESIGRTVSYSVNTYISSMQDCGAASLEALVKALYNYGASAAAYNR